MNNTGFAPEPADMIERLFRAAQTRNGDSFDAAMRQVDNLLKDMQRIKGLIDAAADLAEADLRAASRQLEHSIGELEHYKNRTVPHVINAIVRVAQNVQRPNPARQPIDRPQIEQTVAAMRSEFNDVRIEKRREYGGQECLVVRTFNILLQHTDRNGKVWEYDFGQFDIALNLTKFEARVPRPYLCIAVTPQNLPGSNITHPHVDGGNMCEGNAVDVIPKVLDAGDFYSFFLIVNQTLSNYNPGSPFIHLEEFVRLKESGETGDEPSCVVCGEPISESDETVCFACSRSCHMDDCEMWCRVIDEHICNNCLDYARSRGHACGSCGHIGEPECLVREDPVCNMCGERMNEDDMLYCGVTGREMCRACFRAYAEEEEPCENCTHSGNPDCLLRTEFDVEFEALEASS